MAEIIQIDPLKDRIQALLKESGARVELLVSLGEGHGVIVISLADCLDEATDKLMGLFSGVNND